MSGGAVLLYDREDTACLSGIHVAGSMQGGACATIFSQKVNKHLNALHVVFQECRVNVTHHE